MSSEDKKPTVEQRLQAAHKKLMAEIPELEGLTTSLIWKSRTNDEGVHAAEPTVIMTPRTTQDETSISLGFFLGITAAGMQLIELSTTGLARAALANQEIARMDLDDDVPV